MSLTTTAVQEVHMKLQPRPSALTVMSKWPEPHLSIGAQCHPLGRNQCWEVIGPARDISSGILEAARSLLNSCSDYLNEGEREQCMVIFGLYMIGKNKEKACPTLLFSCESKGPRRRAIELAKREGLLKTFPSIKLAESSRPPQSLEAPILLGSKGKESKSDPIASWIESSSMEILGSSEICFLKSNRVCGIVLAERNSLGPSTSRMATLGGIVCWQNKYFGLTAAHAFTSAYDSAPLTFRCDSEFAFDTENNERSDDEDNLVSITSEGSISSASESSITTPMEYRGERRRRQSVTYISDASLQHDNSSSTDNWQTLGKLLSPSGNECTDWALIKIENPAFTGRNLVTWEENGHRKSLQPRKLATESPSDHDVVLATGLNGVVKGTITSTPSCILLPLSLTYQEVWAIRLDQVLAKGNSGTWVLDARSGDLFGHIIAGHPESKIAYMLSAEIIFSQLGNVFGGKFDLPTIEYSMATSTMCDFGEGVDLGLSPPSSQNRQSETWTPNPLNGSPTTTFSSAPSKVSPPQLDDWNSGSFIVATTPAPKYAMNAPAFVPSGQAFRQPNGTQHTYQSLSVTTMNTFTPEGASNTTQLPPSSSAFVAGPSSVIIRRLPVNTTEETLRLMVVWSKEFINAEVLPPEKSEDSWFRSAILHFSSHAGAQEAKSVLGRKANIANNTQIVVEMYSSSPTSTWRNTIDNTANPGPTSSTSSIASSTSAAPCQSSRYNSTFPITQRVSPLANTSNKLLNPENSTHYKSVFSPQSSIRNNLNDRIRVKRKSLINNDSIDDDETSELLKDLVAYTENGGSSIQPRRTTNLDIPVSGFVGLSFNTSITTSSVPLSFNNTSQPLSSISHSTPISPTALTKGGPPVSYQQLSSQHYQRHNFPSVKPVNQNPPCNTLYVSNLPIDASEDELKAMFSKQHGYKRLLFRTKQNGPMCFVEFEDVSFATKALHELYGQPLHNSIMGGIRLSFSQNPLGVRLGQGMASSNPSNISGMMPVMNGVMLGSQGTTFSTANGPPPGLSAKPGLGLSAPGAPRGGPSDQGMTSSPPPTVDVQHKKRGRPRLRDVGF